MSGAAKCGRVREWMPDAASGLLSDARRGEFQRHIGDCAVCRTEFARVENLVGRIDGSLRAEFAVEPSPKLVLSVRESIAAESQGARLTVGWLGRNSWLSAAGVCAAVAALLIFMVAHRADRPLRNVAPHQQIGNSAPARVPATPSRSASAESIPSRVPAAPRRNASAEDIPLRAPTAPSHGLSAENISPRAHLRVNKPGLALARHESPRIPRRHSTEPEVIVQPGQMQAILQFVVEMQKGKINGAQIARAIQAAKKPLQIKPLEIAPLEPNDGANNAPTAGGRESGSANGR